MARPSKHPQMLRFGVSEETEKRIEALAKAGAKRKHNIMREALEIGLLSLERKMGQQHLTAIKSVSDIYELCDALQVATDQGVPVDFDLPTFGGDAPEMDDAYSWDEAHALLFLDKHTIIGSMRGPCWYLAPRDESALCVYPIWIDA